MQTILLVQTFQTVNDWELKVQFSSMTCNCWCSKYILNYICIGSFAKNDLSLLEQRSTNPFQKFEQNLSIAFFLNGFSYVVLDWPRIVVFSKARSPTLISDQHHFPQYCFPQSLTLWPWLGLKPRLTFPGDKIKITDWVTRLLDIRVLFLFCSASPTGESLMHRSCWSKDWSSAFGLITFSVGNFL